MRTHLIRLGAVAALAVGLAASAAAQTPAPGATTTEPSFELTGGYQLLHITDQTFPFGLNVDGAWNLNPQFGVVGEIGWAYDSEGDDDLGVDANLHMWNVGVGGRWNYRAGRLWPYAQVLIGAAHARASVSSGGADFDDSTTHFMLQPGAGVNYLVGDGWGIVGAVDYRRVFFDDEDFGDAPGKNQVRFFAGVRMILD